MLLLITPISYLWCLPTYVKIILYITILKTPKLDKIHFVERHSCCQKKKKKKKKATKCHVSHNSFLLLQTYELSLWLTTNKEISCFTHNTVLCVQKLALSLASTSSDSPIMRHPPKRQIFFVNTSFIDSVHSRNKALSLIPSLFIYGNTNIVTHYMLSFFFMSYYVETDIVLCLHLFWFSYYNASTQASQVFCKCFF